jgi:hypothetical protein
MPSWDWWDAWKSGDPDESKRALEAETDRSLDKDPGRWSWRNTDEVEIRTRINRAGRADRRHHSGKGHVDKGQSDERTTWNDDQWDRARDDYRRQNEWADREDDRGEGKGIFW